MSNFDPQMPILILSSRPETISRFKSILEHLQFKDISFLDNGILGLKHIQDKPPQLVICDMNVKFISGWLLVKEVKTSEKLPNLPMMLIGDGPSPATEDELKSYGVVKYMQAPYKDNDVSFLIHSTLTLFKTSGTIENKYSHAKKALMSAHEDKAIELYSELRGLTQKSARSSLGLADAYMQKGMVEKAEDVIMDIKPGDENNPTSLMMRAKILLNRGLAQDARVATEKLIEDIAPDVPFYYTKSMRLYLGHQQDDFAERIALEGIRRQFKIPEFYLTLARIQYAKSLFDNTMNTLNEVEQLYGASDEILNIRGVCLKKLGRYQEALQAYEQALKISPMDAKVYFNLASCAIAIGDLPQAKKYLESCLNIDPKMDRAKAKLDELNQHLAKKGAA